MVRNSFFFFTMCVAQARGCVFSFQKKKRKKKDSVTHIPNKLETEKKVERDNPLKLDHRV